MYILINFYGRYYEILIVKVKFYELFVVVFLLFVLGLNKIIYLYKIWNFFNNIYCYIKLKFVRILLKYEENKKYWKIIVVNYNYW